MENERENPVVVIIGSGPAATATALHLLRLGICPLIIERDAFPRYHIGESLTGECRRCLAALGIETQMSGSGYPVKYGVTVWGKNGRNNFWVPVQKRDSEGCLVESTTWQVRRDQFDRELLDEAIRRGALFLQGAVTDVVRDGSRVVGVRVRLPGEAELREIRARVVVDASGQATFLASCGVTGEKNRGSYSRQAAFFSQVRGAIRDEGPASGNTLIFFERQHHWAWFIPLNDAITSVGIVVPGAEFRASGSSADDFLKHQLLHLNSELARRMQKIEFVQPTRTISNYSYHVRQFTGPGFLCVGDSHRFIDPIFSFGVFFALKEAELAAAAIKQALDTPVTNDENLFVEYEQRVERGQQIVEDLVDCFWEFPLAFQRMIGHTHRDDLIDVFAGRIYDQDDELSDGVQTIRRMLNKRRQQNAQLGGQTASA